MSRKGTAAALRTLAVARERRRELPYGLHGWRTTRFTCLAIGAAAHLGETARRAYEDMFEFRGETENANDLWTSDDVDDRRVLLLCFAAALAETGDL